MPPLPIWKYHAMSTQSAELDTAQPSPARPSELIYHLEDRPPLPQTLFAACQHLLAMFVAVITPGLLICQALGKIPNSISVLAS
ncbi:transport protein, symporter [Yersinia pseudotuberculosis]|nr:Xanthine permease XanP [Yersinia pseudotuberculosis]SUP83386.1 transport protein, symporter [Yersinia pseudotuberculosis]